MKVYCQKCGAKIEFSVRSKPKFCHGCGSSLSLGTDQAASDKEDMGAQDAENDDDVIQQVPLISGLEIDIDIHEVKPESLGALMGTSKEYTKQPSSNVTPLSKEEFRQEFQREAGSLRPSGSPPKTDEK